MDWANQNKFKNSLIGILLFLNLLTVSIIWMQTAKRNEQPPKEQGNRPSESINLMRTALDLDEGQTQQFQKLRAVQLGQSKKYNDRLDDLKRGLAEELFTKSPDTTLARLKAVEIGEMQAYLELLRFTHFKELLAICSPEQKEKLKPILIEIFSRKPPKSQQPDQKQLNDQREEKRKEPARDPSPIQRNGSTKRPEREPFQNQRDQRPGPPSVDEKLARFSERLGLSAEQAQKIRALLLQMKQKDEQLRLVSNPDQNIIQTEKERNRQEEDDGIMKILDEEQKQEYAKMILNRRK
jgi:hypothetical protein